MDYFLCCLLSCAKEQFSLRSERRDHSARDEVPRSLWTLAGVIGPGVGTFTPIFMTLAISPFCSASRITLAPRSGPLRLPRQATPRSWRRTRIMGHTQSSTARGSVVHRSRGHTAPRDVRFHSACPGRRAPQIISTIHGGGRALTCSRDTPARQIRSGEDIKT